MSKVFTLEKLNANQISDDPPSFFKQKATNQVIYATREDDSRLLDIGKQLAKQGQTLALVEVELDDIEPAINIDSLVPIN